MVDVTIEKKMRLERLRQVSAFAVKMLKVAGPDAENQPRRGRGKRPSSWNPFLGITDGRLGTLINEVRRELPVIADPAPAVLRTARLMERTVDDLTLTQRQRAVDCAADDEASIQIMLADIEWLALVLGLIAAAYREPLQRAAHRTLHGPALNRLRARDLRIVSQLSSMDEVIEADRRRHYWLGVRSAKSERRLRDELVCLVRPFFEVRGLAGRPLFTRLVDFLRIAGVTPSMTAASLERQSRDLNRPEIAAAATAQFVSFVSRLTSPPAN